MEYRISMHSHKRYGALADSGANVVIIGGDM